MVVENIGATDPPIALQSNGKRVQQLGEKWTAEYFEDAASGLWRAELFHREVPEWASVNHASLEEAARAVREYLDQC